MTARHAMFNLQLAQLRADNNNITTLPRTPESMETVKAFSKQAEDLEQEYREWFDNEATSWAPTTAAWISRDKAGDPKTAQAFQGRVELYADPTQAHRYNVSRSA